MTYKMSPFSLRAPIWSFLMLALALPLLARPALTFPRMCREARFTSWRRGDFNSDNCRYGWEVDVCGVKQCTKGPGDLCGGKHQRYGICGEGLMCSNCNRCYGCSLKTFECYEDGGCNYFLKK